MSSTHRFGRRTFLGASGLALAAAGWSAAPALAAPRFPGNPFTLGIASGDPAPDGMVLWTRLAPDPLAEDGHGGMPGHQVPVRWEVAHDEGFRRVARRGVAFATPELGHSVHVEVTGLEPARGYFYRFLAGSEASPVGRTRTTPAAGAAVSALSFAVASCQRFDQGFYTAYRHLAAEDHDLVVHLGDYLYEYGLGDTAGVRNMSLPAQYQTQPETVEAYRNRYALYKSDGDLQAAHAAFPWIVTLDDHEIDNNWADSVPEERDENHGEPEEVFLRRRAAAFQAYYEHLPLRRSSMPRGPDMQLYRRVAYGALAEFNVLDERQFRSDQVCADGLKSDCADRLDPARTMLGEQQERWLLDGLSGSTAQWNVLAQQVVLSQRDFETGPVQTFSMDSWDGYAASRNHLVAEIARRGIGNPVVLAGDIHRHLASNLKLDFDDPDSATVAAEFVGTSISSGGDGKEMDERGQVFLDENPHFAFNSPQRGYLRCTVTPQEWRGDFRSMPYVSTPGAPIETRATFVVESGVPGLQQA
jgi:alkaline phosphatase D